MHEGLGGDHAAGDLWARKADRFENGPIVADVTAWRRKGYEGALNRSRPLMRRLILFRHAKAEPRAGAQKDIDRPLAPRGRKDAALMGKVLARRGLVPDLALVSDSKRTRETWERLAPACPGAKARYSHDLYYATP